MSIIITSLDIDCGKNVAFNLTKEQVAQIMAHAACAERVLRIGLKNIIGDSHASVVRDDFATDQEWIAAKRAKAQQTLDGLLSGEVRVARAASGVDSFTAMARRFVFSLLGKADKKKLSEMAEAERVTLLDKMYAANAEKLEPLVRERMAKEQAERDAKAAIASELNITL